MCLAITQQYQDIGAVRISHGHVKVTIPVKTAHGDRARPDSRGAVHGRVEGIAHILTRYGQEY